MGNIVMFNHSKEGIIGFLRTADHPVWLGGNLFIYRIPDRVYQMFFDMVPQSSLNIPVEHTKERILRELKDFVSEKFPDMVIVNLEDFNKDEAAKIHPNLRYGMYVQLAEGSYDGTIGIENSLKQLAG